MAELHQVKLGTGTYDAVTKGYVDTALANKQDTLVSGTNIKTVGGQSLLGSGDIPIQGGGTVDQTYDATSTNAQSGTAVAEAVAGAAYDDTALAARVTANTDAMTNLLSRTYATKGAYNSLVQDCDEILPPDSAANCYRVFMPVAKRNNRNLVDYVFEITFNDGTENTLLWVTPSSENPVYGYETYGNLRDGVMYDAKDRDGNLFCYFNEAQYYPGGGATPTKWGLYIIATDRSTSPGGSSETLGNRIAKIEAYEPITIHNVSEYVNEDFNLAEAATHADVASGVAEAKAYADGKALVTQTGWGVVAAGTTTITASIPHQGRYANIIDVSGYGFASADDYEVVATFDDKVAQSGHLMQTLYLSVSDKTAANFKLYCYNYAGGAVNNISIHYTIIAKGYGAVAYTGEIPTGGTAGQILTKRSDADGDYGWQNKLPSYIVDKPEGSDSVSGNVVQVGNFVNTDSVEYGIYEFYYRTSALPAADTTKVFPLTPLLDDYTILDFIDATGVTGNGHFIGSGRTDGTNRIIVQQFSKNNKTFTMRAYGDYTAQTALVKIKFIGTKTV